MFEGGSLRDEMKVETSMAKGSIISYNSIG